MNSDKKITEKVINLLFIILGLVPIFVIALAFKWATPTPMWDEWMHIPQITDAIQHGITWEYLWSQHNEHRPVLFRLMFIMLAKFFNFKLELLIYGNLIISLVNLVLIYLLLRRSSNSNEIHVILFSMVISSWLVFSPVQWESWTWAGQLVAFLAITGLLITALGVQNLYENKKGFGLMAFGGLVSTYSFGSGMIIWFAALLVLGYLLFSKRTLLHKKYLIGWLVLTLLHYVVYSIGYVKPSHHPDLAVNFGQLIPLFKYVLIYLGAPLGSLDISISMVSGLGLLISFAFLLIQGFKTDRIDIMIPWIFIFMFIFGVALITGIVRAGFGLEQAISSRYTTNSTFGWVAVLILLAQLNPTQCSKISEADIFYKITSFIIVGMLIIASLPNYKQGLNNMMIRFNILSKGYDTTLNYKYASAGSISSIAPSIQLFNRGAQIMESRKWGPFADVDYKQILQNYDSAKSSSMIGYIDVVLVSPETSDVTVVGWAAEPNTRNSVERVYLIIDNSKVVSTKPTIIRNDVENVLGVNSDNSLLAQTFWLQKKYGWSITLPKDKFKSGNHFIKAVIKGTEVDEYYVLNGIKQFSL